MGGRNKGFSGEYLELKITPHVSHGGGDAAKKKKKKRRLKLINECESVSSVMKSAYNYMIFKLS